MYTADDFDENGQFIRDPKYMAPRSVVEQAVAHPRTEEELIALKQQEIAAEKLRLAQEEDRILTEKEQVRKRTVREPFKYTRPTEYPTYGGEKGLTTGRPIANQEFPDKFTFAENAAANGVDVTTGLPAATRTAASLLSFNKPVQQAAIENEVRNDLGPDFPDHEMVLARDPASGMTAYLRKDGDGFRWTLVNPPGLDVGDVIEFSGELPTFLMETAGAVGGGIVGSAVEPGIGTVVGATAGATFMGATSIPLRVELAKMAGIPQSVIDNIDISDEAAWQALMSGGGELAGHTIVGAVSSLRNFFGRSLELDDIPALQAKVKERLATIAAAEEVSGVQFQPSLGQLTGDTDIQIAEASLKGEASGKTAQHIRRADIDNDKAAAQAMRNLATQEVRAPSEAGFRSVEEITQEVEERLVKRQTDVPSAARDVAQTEVTTFDELYDVASDRTAFEALQEGSEEAQTAARKLQDDAWDLHRKTIEWDPDPKVRSANIKLDNTGPTPIRTFMNQLQADANHALMTTLAKANKATLEASGFGTDAVKSMMEGGDPTGLASELLDTRHLHVALSHLKRVQRQMKAGVSTDGFELNDVSGLIGAIEEQMATGNFRRLSSGRTVNPQKADQIRASWLNANTQTDNFHTTFNTASMRELLKPRRVVVDGKTQTVFDLPPGFVRRRMFAKGDARALQESLDAVGHDPAIRAGLAQEFMKYARSETIVNGRVQAGKFNDFMDLHEDHMSLLLGADQASQITNLGSMGRIVDTQSIRAEHLAELLKRRYGRVVAEPTAPFNIATEILGPRMSSGQATNLMNDVRRLDPQLALQVEEKVMERIFNGVSKADKKLINFNQLDNLLVEKRDTLMAVGGRRYVRDLDTLRDALEIMAEKRFSKPVKTVLQGPWQRATRLLFGPLGREQRFISAVGRAARASRAGTIKDMLANPAELRRFAKLKHMKATDPRFWAGVLMFSDNDLRNVFIEGNPDEYAAYQRGELKDRRNTEVKGGL